MAQREADTTWSQWDGDSLGGKNMAAGAILASAVTAGLVAYLVRRARQGKRSSAAGLAAKAFERTRGSVSGEALGAGREFFIGKIVPEMKPVLLAMLEELQDATEAAFRRAEKTIKSL